MDYSKIIYISYQPLTAIFERNFYIKELQEAGVEIEYWDLTNIYKPGLELNHSLTAAYVKPFSSIKEIRLALNRNKGALFVVFITLTHEVSDLFRVLAQADVQTCFFARGMLPAPVLNAPFLTKLKKKAGQLTSLRYINRVISNYLLSKVKGLGYIKTHNIVFTAGSEGIYTVGMGAEKERSSARLIPVNSLDYDHYLSLKQHRQRLIEGPYAVFLDIYLPYHPDLAIVGMKSIDAEEYFRSLNMFFDKLESTYHVKVVIAAHPKADYTVNPYNGRTILMNKTADLVSDASFVISHISTAVSFAVLFSKPVLFAYNNQIYKSYKHNMFQQIKHFSEVLKAPLINIDEDNIKLNKLFVHEEAYMDYKYKYLTSLDTQHTSTKEIIFSLLEINDAHRL